MTAVKVAPGMLLLANDCGTDRVDLWAVKSVKGTSVVLVRATDSTSAEATARFPGGEVREPFRLWCPSSADRRHIYDRLHPAGRIARVSYERQPIEVACPYCDALLGHRCRVKGSGERPFESPDYLGPTTFHKARRAAADSVLNAHKEAPNA